jgi:tetratricopeptide (TPR) repeat protein
MRAIPVPPLLRPGRATQLTLAELLAASGTVRDAGEAEALFDAVAQADMRGQPGPDMAARAGPLLGRGSTRVKLGRWAEAEADFRAVLARDPGNAAALNHLGYGLAERGERLDEAVALLRRAVALAPRSGHALDSLGWALLRAGRHNEALGHLERALELEPANAEIADHLGDAYWHTGRESAARLEWRRALALGADQARAEAISTKLVEGLAPQTATGRRDAAPGASAGLAQAAGARRAPASR